MKATDVHSQRESFHVLDVREDDEWVAGHIEGAQHIPLGQLATRIAEVPTDRTIVCVCLGGVRSENARRGLERLGISAENLEGGVIAWARAGFPLFTPEGTPGRIP